MTEHNVRSVLVVRATGRIGRLAVAAARRHGLDVRALVRDEERARVQLPNATLITGDLTKVGGLTAAVRDVDTILFTHGSADFGYPKAFEAVDYGAVANTLRTLDGRRAWIVLMTSINVNDRTGTYQDVLDWKRRGERLLRASGVPYTIVRPGWFASLDPTDQGLRLEQGDTRHGDQVDTGQLAEVLVRSLITDAAMGKTFEVFSGPGPAPDSWDTLFTPLDPDEPG